MRTLRLLVPSIMTVGMLAALPLHVFASPGRFMSAGVSLQGRQIKQPAGYSLKLVFANSSGDYLADVAVTVKHKDGKVLGKTTSKGPWLFVKAPHGRYEITATRDHGPTLKRMVTAPAAGGMREKVFYFPSRNG